jgi:hypothetical protein
MQGIHNCTPNTNRVSNAHSVAPIFYLQCFVHTILLSMYFCTFTLALPEVCVQGPNGFFFVVSLPRTILVSSSNVL